MCLGKKNAIVLVLFDMILGLHDLLPNAKGKYKNLAHKNLTEDISVKKG